MDLIIVPISFAAKLTLAREINWIFLSLHWTHLVSMIYFFSRVIWCNAPFIAYIAKMKTSRPIVWLQIEPEKIPKCYLNIDFKSVSEFSTLKYCSVEPKTKNSRFSRSNPNENRQCVLFSQCASAKSQNTDVNVNCAFDCSIHGCHCREHSHLAFNFVYEERNIDCDTDLYFCIGAIENVNFITIHITYFIIVCWVLFQLQYAIAIVILCEECFCAC